MDWYYGPGVLFRKFIWLRLWRLQKKANAFFILIFSDRTFFLFTNFQFIWWCSSLVNTKKYRLQFSIIDQRNEVSTFSSLYPDNVGAGNDLLKCDWKATKCLYQKNYCFRKSAILLLPGSSIPYSFYCIDSSNHFRLPLVWYDFIKQGQSCRRAKKLWF